MKFHSEDNGNCRVYFMESKRVYCWQNDGNDRRPDWVFYACSRDGEPSHPVTPPAVTPRPPGETSIGRELLAYLATREA